MIIYKFSNNMKILFIGINPHYGSYRRGTPFSNNKTFWYLLNKAGLIHENEDLRNDTTLNHIYIHKFNQFYNLGFVNLIDRPTHDISELEKGEENTGRRRILLIIRKYEPPTVCFIGKVSFAKFSKSKNFNFRWQKKLCINPKYL